jgi:hypothetical protein
MARRETPATGGAKRRRRKTPVVERVFWIGTAVAVALVMFAVCCKIVRPFRLWFTEKQSVGILRVQLAQLKRENGELKIRQEYLRSPIGAQNEARKLGYVNPGETPIVVEPAKPNTTK